jgi:hypothetical protein
MAAKREQIGITGMISSAVEATSVSLQCFQTLSTGRRSAQPDAFWLAALGFIRICRLSPRAVPALPAERSAHGREIAQAEFARDRTGI